MFGHALTLVFLVAASLNSIVTLFFLCRIAKMVYQALPNNESMLGFWLSLTFLLVWLSGMTYSLLAYP